jgi:Uma2 family endonuclease
MSEVFAKCEDYHAWGVQMVWIVDPESERAWEYGSGQRPLEVGRTGSLQAEGISIRMGDVLSVL